MGLLVSSMSKCGESTPRRAVEMLALLVLYAVQCAERVAVVAKRKTGNAGGTSGSFDWSHLKTPLLNAVRGILGLPLDRICDGIAGRDVLLGVLVRITHAVLESDPRARSLAVETMAFAVRRYAALASSVASFALHDLHYNEAMAEPVADLLAALPEECDTLQSVLDELATRPLSESAARSVGSFLARLSTIAGRRLHRSLASFIGLLDCPHYPLRMAMLETVSALIAHLLLSDSRDEQALAQARSLFALLQERLRDISSFVRAKALHVLAELTRYRHDRISCH